MDLAEEQNVRDVTTVIDESYEFKAPRWYDFLNGDTKDEKQRAELWFESALSYAPSPSVPRIKARRSFKVESMRSFNEEDDELFKANESSEAVAANEENQNNNTIDVGDHVSVAERTDNKEIIPPVQTEAYTPNTTGTKKPQTARKMAGTLRNSSVLKPKNQSQSSQAKCTLTSMKREMNLKNVARTPNQIQDCQAIKRQKLDGGKSRQILNPKLTALPHKTKEGLVNTSLNLCPSVSKNTRTENRKKLTLTRPVEPEFMTSQRIRPARLKSSAELEEEMLATMPKFKARPLYKKILAAPTLPTPQRSTPRPPTFQEFRLETMVRASQYAETHSVASTEVSKHNDWRPYLTEPKSPLLQTMMRARPTKAKTSTEIEQEELEKVPKFKARPLNRKIFESKGEMGVFCNTKKHITIPQEFHFVTDERISRPNSVVDLFDKLSLNSESCREKPLPRNTTPNPFHLITEERGAEKEKKFVTEVIHKQIEDERARVPKANPYPYTTDFPVVPPKPEPKQCTRPEPFQLESLTRHEEEVRKEMEERMRMEREEAQRRVFTAQPVIKEDPIPVPEKVRKPLTEIQQFTLHADYRAVKRADFDHKIKEKEMMYKRYREETEAARMVEEERALKQLRRTMVPHARPLPNFNKPFTPQRSNMEVTKPKSPKLRVTKRTEWRRSMMARPTATNTTSATHMR